MDAVESICSLKRRIHLVSKRDSEIAKIEGMMDGYATSLTEWTNKPRRRKITSGRTDKRVISDSRISMTQMFPRYTDEMNNSKETLMSRRQKIIEATKRKQISPAEKKKEENRKGMKPLMPMYVEQTLEIR